MKHSWILFPVLALALTLAACGARGGGAAAEERAAGEAVSAAPVPEGPPEEPCVHQPAQEDSVMDQEAAGYCGNTVTTVSREDGAWDGPVSFWGSGSVALTDLLLHLDYSGDVCRCMPEYSVDTEFGTGYGISLTGSYVRRDGGQARLTEEQTAEMREILEHLPEEE